jgi:transposase
MFALTEAHRFYFYNRPADMRKSFDALSGLVRSGMCKDPLSGEVFVFTNKTRTLMKLLQWQNGGFVLYCKKLEQGRFEFAFGNDGKGEKEITHAELTMLVAGISLRNIRKLKRYSK